MKATIAAVGMCVCFVSMAGLGIWLGFERDAEKQRADAAEARAEKLSIGQDFLAALVKQIVKEVKANCANELAVCKQEAIMELPCYPHCSTEER
jgi:hypothetical protein